MSTSALHAVNCASRAGKAVTTTSLRRVLKSGAANGQSVATLAFLLDTTERAVRRLTDELIEEGVPVCAHPSTGYYIAVTPEEVQGTYDFLRARALHGLAKASQLRSAFTRYYGADLGDDDPLPEL